MNQRTDSERVDWMENHYVEVRTNDALVFWRWHSKKGSPLRKYIDDAMDAEATQSTPESQIK